MASQTQISPEDFVAIAGDVTLEDAEKYLKMGKNNLELALNYYFNKKDKTFKPYEEPAKPLTLFQKLQEGGKKQERVEKMVKDLTNESTRYKKISENVHKKDSTENTTKKNSGASLKSHSQSQSQKTSSKKTVEKNSGNKATNSVQKNSSDTKTPETKNMLNNFFGSVTKENKKPVTPSTGGKEILEEDKFEGEKSFSMGMIIEDSFASKDIFNKSNSRLDFEDYKHTSEEIRNLEEQVISQFNRQSSLAIELQASDPHPMEEEKSENSMFATTGKTTKNFKRNFMKFVTMHDMSNENKSTERTEERAMVIENSVVLEGWPKFLGNLQVKASVISSLKINIQQGKDLMRIIREILFR